MIIQDGKGARKLASLHALALMCGINGVSFHALNRKYFLRFPLILAL